MTDNDKPVWTETRFRQPVDDLCQYGPTIVVDVAAHPFAGGPMQRVKGQIDTGAHGTALSIRLIERLSLSPCEFGVIQEAGRDPIDAPKYMVRLAIPDMDLDLKVTGLKMGSIHDVLIGRDVLSRYRLVVDFTTGRFQLHFKHES